VLSKVDASKAVFPNLQHLHISCCHNLHIGSCDHLVEVGALPTTLQTLYICTCTKLEELPSMETLVSLEEFCTRGCRELKRIHGLGQALTELEELGVLDVCRSLNKVAAFRCKYIWIK
jgi:hypothetical protein